MQKERPSARLGLRTVEPSGDAAAMADEVTMGLVEPPQRIALLHLDGLSCLPALELLFAGLGNRIGLVISSDRFAGPMGFWRQLVRNLAHSGLRMTLALGFDIVALRIAAVFAPSLRRLGPFAPLYTVGEHARRNGAAFFVAGDINGPTSQAVLRQFKPDLVLSFHFDQILKPAFLEAVAAPVLNVHPALLPAHRGPCPSFWVLAAGDVSSGVTVHRIVDASIDSGEALVCLRQLVPTGVCVAELDERLFEEGARAVVDLLTAGQVRADDPMNVASSDPSGSYESFPDRGTARAARRKGVRLWRLAHAVRLLMRLFGWRRA